MFIFQIILPFNLHEIIQNIVNLIILYQTFFKYS